MSSEPSFQSVTGAQTPEPVQGELAEVAFLSPAEQLELDLGLLGFSKGRDFTAILFDPKSDRTVVLGMPDERTAIAIQAAIATSADELSEIYRGVCAERWALSCVTFDSMGTPSSELDLEYWSGEGEVEGRDSEPAMLNFIPWLVEATQEAQAILADHDIQFLRDYKVVDTDQDLCGIDVGGIETVQTAQRIAAALITHMPQFRHIFRYFDARPNHDPGWHVRVFSFPQRGEAKDLTQPMSIKEFDRYKNWNLFVSYDLVAMFEDNSLYSKVGTLRDTLAQSGIGLPTTRVRDDLDMPLGTIRLELNGKTLNVLDNVSEPTQILEFLRKNAFMVQRS